MFKGKEMRYIVDRFEGMTAVCEDENGRAVSFHADKLPENVKAGDILVRKDGAFFIDRETAEKRRAELTALQESLWSK